jgi:toxin YoeB
MAKKVIWAKRAQNDRKEILAFWVEHNQSSTYSKKLDALFKEAVRIIKRNPEIGKPTDIEGVRIKVISHYLMFYEIIDESIYILTIWDSRRNPDSLKL